MYVNGNAETNETGGSFWDRFAEIPGPIESRVPTFDKSLDAYFDRRFSAIIEEWDLVTESDLVRLDRRLERITSEISGLYAERAASRSPGGKARRTRCIHGEIVMIGMDRYLDAYVDRRMAAIVEEWDLATQSDLGNIPAGLLRSKRRSQAAGV